MKHIFTILMVAVMFFSGCTKKDTPLATNSPSPEGDIFDQTTPTINPEATPTPEAKITSDFENAPTLQDIQLISDKEMSAVLLQDMLVYQLPLNKHFAVALQEEAEKEYRWLLSGENGLYEYVEELHINGYRVFVFMPKSKGETSIDFELTQGGATLIDILSYQLNFN